VAAAGGWASLACAALAAQPVTVSEHPAPGAMISVGSHRLHLHCLGSGAPTVVLEAGLGGTAMEWVRVQEPLSRRFRTCAYDRAGYGWSERGPLPRRSATLAAELHRLLQRAGESGPYVLVGHSFGGYNVRLFAARYPGEAAALLLLDASHERQHDRFEALGLSTAPRRGGIVWSTGRGEVPSAMPQALKPLARSLAATPRARLALGAEAAELRQSADQVAAAPVRRDLPVAVISRGRREWPDTEAGRRLERTWRELQLDLAGRVGSGTHAIASRSGHFVQLEQPELVIRAVGTLVERLRD
jgi:pimeloyl-ACP methyl ester carboxylesterase